MNLDAIYKAAAAKAFQDNVDPGNQDQLVGWIRSNCKYDLDNEFFLVLGIGSERGSPGLRICTKQDQGEIMIIDFLQTKRSKDDLRITLEVLREFKSCESMKEWVSIPFAAWAKVEQLQEYLEHLVDGKDLESDTLDYIEANKLEYQYPWEG